MTMFGHPDDLWWNKRVDPAQDESKQRFKAVRDGVGIRGAFQQARAVIRRVRRIEGERGIADRITIVKRQSVAFLSMFIAAGIVRACLEGTSWTSLAMLMLASLAIMEISAAIATLFFPDKRPEILHQLNEVVGLSMTVTVALSLADFAIRRFISDPTHQDPVSTTAAMIMPYAMLMTIIGAMVIYIRMIITFRYENRDRVDDEENLGRMQRFDGPPHTGSNRSR